jgi:hypothetical protein
LVVAETPALGVAVTTALVVTMSFASKRTFRNLSEVATETTPHLIKFLLYVYHGQCWARHMPLRNLCVRPVENLSPVGSEDHTCS